MKLTLITPVNKGISKLEVYNYRPVFILPILSKVLEELMLNRLTEFLGKNKIIYGHQFGFQKINQPVLQFWTPSKELLVP